MNAFEQKMKDRTKHVGIEILKLVDELPSKASVWIITKQIVRSGTSIGANYRAACRSKSNADFLYKLTLVEEEADETIYWLDLLQESGNTTPERISKVKDELHQITSIIVASIKTIKAKSI